MLARYDYCTSIMHKINVVVLVQNISINSRIFSCDLLQQLCIKNYFFDFIDFKFNKSKSTFFRLSTFVFSSEGGLGLGLRYSFLGFTTHTELPGTVCYNSWKNACYITTRFLPNKFLFKG